MKSIKTKIILSSAACILLFGIFSNVYLYSYLTQIIEEKANRIDQLNLQTMQTRLTQSLEELAMLGNLCAYDLDIAHGMRNHKMLTVDEKKSVLRAEKTLQRYLDSYTNLKPFVSCIIAFNEDGIRAQAIAREFNSQDDADKIMATDAFHSLADSGDNYIMTIAPSIKDGASCIIFISHIYDFAAALTTRGTIYIELEPGFIDYHLSAFSPGDLFLTDSEGMVFPQGYANLPPVFDLETFSASKTLALDGNIYNIISMPLGYAGLILFSRMDITYLSADANAIFHTTFVVTAMSLTVALVLAILSGVIITKPINRLTNRLRYMSSNGFTREPLIEKGSGEIAEMGRVINEMTDSINALLKETEEMHIQNKNSEIALLQSQVNPHFLYNTLDSIRWMATIQKNPGIEKTARALSNLLKNLAKGVGDKITLQEEISLLRDYIETQSVRFMGLFELEDHIPESLRNYEIVKFTLQPLVENAIFHGIVPSGECGKIILSAKEEDEYLIICVEDNGIGMSEEELKTIAALSLNPHKEGMASIGVANVDNRLKLVYGEKCGLFYESNPNVFTRVTVRIKKEIRDVQDTASG